MSHRRPDRGQAAFEEALRHALWLAADSVEPGSDGLARIRTKIAAQPTPQAGWWTTPLGCLLGVVTVLWRLLESAAVRLRYVAEDVPHLLRYAAEDFALWLRYAPGRFVRRVRYIAGDIAYQFGPDLARSGWVKWLRPAAGLATALLVVTGVSFAVTGLGQEVATGNYQTVNGSGSGGSGTHGNSGGGGPNSNGSSSLTTPTSGTSSHVSRDATCRASTPAATPSPKASSTVRPTPSPTPSPSASSSPSPSPSSSATSSGAPSPSSSPTGATVGGTSPPPPGGEVTRSPSAQSLTAAGHQSQGTLTPATRSDRATSHCR